MSKSRVVALLLLSEMFAAHPTAATLSPNLNRAAQVVETTKLTARDLRHLAPIQIVRTDTAASWELLGSADTADWRHLGVFHPTSVLEPLGDEEDMASARGSLRFVVGELVLADGRRSEYVLASLGNVGQSPLIPEGAFTFVVHDTFDGKPEAEAKALGLETAAAHAPAGSAACTPIEETQPVQLFRNAPVFTEPNVCENACETAFSGKLNLCDQSYATCVAGATAAYALCNLACPTTGIGCLVCAGAYAAALLVCDSHRSTCRAAANLDHDACLAGCQSNSGPPEPNSPIVIDLDGRSGFRFTSIAEGVLFDLDGNGEIDRTAWTEDGYEQAFLVLDRNGNGVIDDGRELFGDVTVQPASEEPNGYKALAVFDDPGTGGNGDGVLTAEDAFFPALQLWTDSNHDGQSQAGELQTLDDAGVVGIDTSYVTFNRQDQNGNLLRFRSSVYTGNRHLHSVDVFFVHEPLE